MTTEKELYIDDEEPELTPYDNLGNDIYHSCPDMNDNYCGSDTCVTCLTRKLYALGYRRKEDLAKEFFEELDSIMVKGESPEAKFYHCSKHSYEGIRNKYLGE